MDSEEQQNEHLDTVKIYIWVMSGLTVIGLAWFLYNLVTLNQYDSALRQGMRDLQDSHEAEKLRKPSIHKQVKAEPVNQIFTFFQRTVRNLPEKPQVENGGEQPGNDGGVIYREFLYIIRFQQIDRRNFGRYIFEVQESKPYLKVKRLEMQKAEGIKPYEDKWRVELVFAFRILATP